MSVWGYTTDDFSDDLFSDEDHAFLDSLDEAHARIFAAEQGYDLVDDQGMLTDWWGYCWMILAEKRGLLTPENRAAARAQIEEKYLVGAERDRRHRRAVISLTVCVIPGWSEGPTSDAQLRIGNLEIPGSMLRIAPE